MRQAHSFVYTCLKGEPTDLDLLADVGTVITVLGEYVRQKYGEQDFLELLDFVDTQKMQKERDSRLSNTVYLSRD